MDLINSNSKKWISVYLVPHNRNIHTSIHENLFNELQEYSVCIISHSRQQRKTKKKKPEAQNIHITYVSIEWKQEKKMLNKIINVGAEITESKSNNIRDCEYAYANDSVVGSLANQSSQPSKLNHLLRGVPMLSIITISYYRHLLLFSFIYRLFNIELIICVSNINIFFMIFFWFVISPLQLFSFFVFSLSPKHFLWLNININFDTISLSTE